MLYEFCDKSWSNLSLKFLSFPYYEILNEIIIIFLQVVQLDWMQIYRQSWNARRISGARPNEG